MIQIYAKKCESLQEKVLYLVKIIDIISKGKSNFEDVLASQTCVFGKYGLGFNPQSKQSGCTKTFFNFHPINNRLKSRNNRLFVVSTA